MFGLACAHDIEGMNNQPEPGACVSCPRPNGRLNINFIFLLHFAPILLLFFVEIKKKIVLYKCYGST